MSAHELVDIVDEYDNVVDVVERHVMREKHLPHRASYIVVCDASGRFVTEIRTLNKDYAPGLFDACVGGVMQHQEDPCESAKRELLEEIGIKAESLQSKFYELGKMRVDYQSGRGFLFAYLYLLKTTAISIRQKEEVSGIMFLSIKELRALADSCTYDSLKVFNEIIARAKKENLIGDECEY